MPRPNQQSHSSPLYTAFLLLFRILNSIRDVLSVFLDPFNLHGNDTMPLYHSRNPSTSSVEHPSHLYFAQDDVVERYLSEHERREDHVTPRHSGPPPRQHQYLTYRSRAPPHEYISDTPPSSPATMDAANLDLPYSYNPPAEIPNMSVAHDPKGGRATVKQVQLNRFRLTLPYLPP